MLSWGLGGTLGAVAGGVLGHLLGIRPAMVAMASLTVVAVAMAWTSPLRGGAGAQPQPHLEAAPDGG
jgi:predicted MFS family arabinose efflux permease